MIRVGEMPLDVLEFVAIDFVHLFSSYESFDWLFFGSELRCVEKLLGLQTNYVPEMVLL